jgi:hypothetical protein
MSWAGRELSAESVTFRRAEVGDGAAVAAVFGAARSEMAYLPALHTPDEDRAFFTDRVVGSGSHDVTVAVAEMSRGARWSDSARSMPAGSSTSTSHRRGKALGSAVRCSHGPCRRIPVGCRCGCSSRTSGRPCSTPGPVSWWSSEQTVWGTRSTCPIFGCSGVEHCQRRADRAPSKAAPSDDCSRINRTPSIRREQPMLGQPKRSPPIPVGTVLGPRRTNYL